MAKPKRKPGKSAPIAQHQLFPAVVALWFGALFGLGSLAVRPTLLEELVVKSRIDLLIPAAAPPLGMTARMLVALILAAFGAMIGSLIARRLAQPKQEARERKRTNLSTRDEGADNRGYAGQSDTSTRYGANAAGDFDGDASPGMQANRRRSLTVEHDEDDFVPHELAPLPGGAPQIFDIAACGLNDRPPPVPAFEPVPPVQPAEPVQVAPLPPVAAPVALDWANAAPVLPPSVVPAAMSVSQAIEMQRQVYQAAPEPEQVFAAPAAPAPEDGRQVFGMTPPTYPPADQPRQIFGAPVTDDHVPKEFVEAQGFRTSVFETPEPSPLFPQRAEPAPVPAPAPVPQDDAAPAVPDFAEPLAAPAPVPQAFVPEGETAPADPAPALVSPASLGMEDLSARLAESMRRRRAARSGSAAEPAVEAAPQLHEAETEAAARTVPEFTVPPFAVPAFTVPPVTEAAAPVVGVPIPAALRPLDLTGFEANDAAAYDSPLPPRHIALPVEPAAVASPPQTFAPPAAEEPEPTEEADVAEDEYASLLGVTPSPAVLRNPFVRVEETEVEAETIEPVVIFPGQAVPSPQGFAAPAPSAEDAGPFRRFDAPASAGQGQPVAANEGVSAVAPEEAERALRSALANLQRMSGAA